MTEQEKLILGSLVNPDDPKEQKYNWDFRYQQEILSMLLMDRVFLIQSMQLIRPEYFLDKAHEMICSILFGYFNRYDHQMPPKFAIANEIRQRLGDNERKILIYIGELEALIGSFIPGLESREACMDKITEFAKEQSLRGAVSQTLGLLEGKEPDKWVKIENIFKKALLTDRNFDEGLDYFQTLEERYDRMQKMSEQKEVFVTGFDGIDDPLRGLSAGGLCRGEIGAFMALSGVGKSLALAKCAVRNLLRGKKVLYVTLEMDQDKVAKRFDAMLARENIRTLMDRREFVISGVKERVRDDEDKRRLIIKQFAAGTADMLTIRAYTAQLNLHGFKPDMLCVDYVGEFKDDPSVKLYESRQKIVRDLRGFGVEENHATFTALQPNRQGREAQEESFIDDAQLGDSFGQVRPLDALWSLNQNPAEKALGIGRVFVVKHRDGRSRYSFPFKQDPETLDIFEITDETYGNLRSQFAIKKSEDTESQVNKIISKKMRPNRGDE